MVAITLPDGSTRRYEKPITGADVATDIGPGLAKAALAVRVSGTIRDLSAVIESDCDLSIVTRKDPDALELLRHDAAHVMAEAVQELYPGTQVTIGPAIENGFYYDFAREEAFTPDDLVKIEERMREIVDRNETITREVWEREKAIDHFKSLGEHYKAEIVNDLPTDEPVSIYRQGNWLDLCLGPHLPSTGKLGKAFKLSKLAGAYWRGDSRNTMLQRIYGTAWADEKQLKKYLTMVEEAEKRDHRKIGQEMDLFHLQSEAQGSVFWHSNGYMLWRALEKYLRRRLDSAGYQEVKTPQLMDASQWEVSGHWGKYRENMFVVPDEVPNIEDNAPVISGNAALMAMKPMNCPAHVLIFRQGIKSYRDLPIRMAEFGCCHRNEPHGALHGLMRVRQFTQDDAHIFCREDQIVDEVRRFCELLDTIYKDLGFEAYTIKLALRPENRFGSDEMWDKAENNLRDAVRLTGRATSEYGWEELPGEGAFYSPKLEFHLTDAIGRTWQCGTIQLDYVLPERLDASYIGEDGAKHRPVLLHRAILGTFERFIGILIEHFAGKFPLWLAPIQAVVCTITEDSNAYANDVATELRDAGLRIETDLRNEKINYKIREHSLAKVPVIVIVGKKEVEEQTVALRRLGGAAQEVLALKDAADRLAQESAAP
ncbi:MAG TPA: threonine--tRNA ligase [Rhodospirillaceae bacterium]|nr:threonine--tRNA ligase [Candidatus Neomarinimicrobiota bacterium]HCX14386.1 threonine--tRNA ligase [Rhodospirillaceae bacterium]